MQNHRSTYVRNILLSCLFFSGVAGLLTGILIFLFKFTASHVISLSGSIYAYVRSDPSKLPLLLLGAAVLGIISAVIIKYVPDSRGGGIPTSVAILRGLIPFNWIKSIIFLFTSAMVTYFGGVPLGNEGPSVQMGTAVGRGTVRIFAKKHPGWDRYIMTGGACAGFAAATGSPLTGIFFAFEEAHRRFSPMIFMTSAVAVLASTTVMNLLCELTNTSPALFGFTIDYVLPIRYLWAPVIVGVAAGLFAAVFTKSYTTIRKIIKNTLSHIPSAVKIVIIFVAVAIIGFFSDECIASGHHLIDELIEGYGAWYLLLIFLVVRAFLLLTATNSDITGGLFIPTLALGAIVGAICGKGMVASGALPSEYYVIMVVTGIAAFLSSSSRTPLMAIAFAIEALSGLTNILAVSVGVAFAYIVIEALGISEFSDTVIESKVDTAHEGKESHVVDMHLTVAYGAFAVGKEIRDILWPPTCTVLSVRRNPAHHHSDTAISAGDTLHVHYETYDAEQTLNELEALVGHQFGDINTRMRPSKKDHRIPEI